MLPGMELRRQNVDEKAFRVILKESTYLAYGNGTYLLHMQSFLFSYPYGAGLCSSMITSAGHWGRPLPD